VTSEARTVSAPATAGATRAILIRLARIAIGVVFLVAAYGKVMDPASFALQIHNFRMAPAGSENLLAMVIPWIEMVAGIALVAGIKPRAGAMIVVAMMVFFTFAVGLAWGRGLNIECGCFGTLGGAQVGAKKFAENVGLTILALIAALPLRSPAPRA